MGVCSSCLGNGRRDDFDEDDENRLLFDDPNNIHYGSFGDQQQQIHGVNGQDDPLEVQREIEALQRVVARTSDNMVDIFEIAPSNHLHTHTSPDSNNPYPFADQDAAAARSARYQTLLSKLSSEDLTAQQEQLPMSNWVPWEESAGGGEENNNNNIQLRVKTEPGEPLVGTFAELRG